MFRSHVYSLEFLFGPCLLNVTLLQDVILSQSSGFPASALKEVSEGPFLPPELPPLSLRPPCLPLNKPIKWHCCLSLYIPCWLMPCEFALRFLLVWTILPSTLYPNNSYSSYKTCIRDQPLPQHPDYFLWTPITSCMYIYFSSTYCSLLILSVHISIPYQTQRSLRATSRMCLCIYHSKYRDRHITATQYIC